MRLQAWLRGGIQRRRLQADVMKRFQRVAHPTLATRAFYYNTTSHACVWRKPKVLGEALLPLVPWEDSAAFANGVPAPTGMCTVSFVQVAAPADMRCLPLMRDKVPKDSQSLSFEQSTPLASVIAACFYASTCNDFNHHHSDISC